MTRDISDLEPDIGIVGGNGWIGGALARALVEAGLDPARLTLSCRSVAPEWPSGARWTHDNQALADAAEVIVLSVRPADWGAVALRAPGKLVVSVMAGIPLAEIARATGAERVVRALPNAAAEVGFSYTPWVASPAVTDADRAVIRALLGACGSEDEVPREADIDYLTGHSGTGPAYPALLAAAMTRDAIAHGLPEAVARRAALGILIGTGRIFEKTGEDPEATVAAFVDYKGVTAAAIEAMRAGGFDALIAKGLEAALRKSGGLWPGSSA